MGNIIWIIIMVLITVADQVSKHIVATSVEVGELIPIIDKFFYITYHTNTGAAWGIMQGKLYILIPITITFSIAMIYILFKTKDKLLKLALALVLGGALGNLIDRVIKGGVTDFLDFYFGSYNFPTFNVADIFIVIGTILLGIYIIVYGKELEEEDNEKQTEVEKENV